MPDLHDQMARRLADLTRDIVDRCAAEVPFYRRLSAETLDGQVSQSVTAVLGLFLKLLRNPGALRPADATWVVELSARRARDHLPLEAALTAYLIGAEVWWQAVTELAAPDDLAEAGTRLLDGLSTAMPAVVLAHLQAREDLRSEAKRVRRELLAALLNGQRHQGPAQAAGIEIGQRHTVLMVRFSPRQPDSLVQAALDAHTGTPVLMDPTDGIVLLPAGTVPESLVADLREALDTTVLAAAADAGTPAMIPEAAAEAREVIELLGRLGRPSGLYRFDDVLVEYQLARPGAGLRRLAAKLDPLTDHPYLLQTLQSFVHHGHNRRQTALALHIHRNTLDYRLQRITALTGLDVAVPAQARMLEAAITARDLL
ncbi:helix-turn-helix domain-containing protein [Micromonospora sp. CPCC 206060]|uniref:PucR family transcriptional regulator n=1 Tax=Micromonospora sp. CPCC 206060 TaxID=3122406 RepID=UPI002FF09FE2